MLDPREEKKYKNLVYLMLTRYEGKWRSSFPYDMGLSSSACEELYRTYAKDVAEEIKREREEFLKQYMSETPSADSLIRDGMKKLKTTIAKCDDPSRIATTIKLLTELRKTGDVKAEKKETIFDKIQRECAQNQSTSKESTESRENRTQAKALAKN